MKWSKFWTVKKIHNFLSSLSVCKDEELWALLMAVLWVQLTVWGIQCFHSFELFYSRLNGITALLLRVEIISSGPFSAGCSARSLFSLSRTVFILLSLSVVYYFFQRIPLPARSIQMSGTKIKKGGWKGMLRTEIKHNEPTERKVQKLSIIIDRQLSHVCERYFNPFSAHFHQQGE